MPLARVYQDYQGRRTTVATHLSRYCELNLAKLGETAMAIAVKKHPELAGKSPEEVIR